MSSDISAVEYSDIDLRINERFHLYPKERLRAVAVVSGLVGGLSGFYDGIKTASLRYLTENGHRLPRTVGGWYFYHKKKNYVMILNGCREGFKQGLKFSVAVSGFFGIEWLVDTYIRNNTIDLFNTTAAALISSGAYALYHRLSRVQTRNYIKKGGALGLSLGFAQDLMIFTRGGNIWYIENSGIKNPRTTANANGSVLEA